ncbi:antibiotic biosynthesis monooxygenase [Acidocella sp. KAb 2-4]|uniref:antibiotic biosynthesis monooxygenase family protein n=1 Tax=Acidocella sp. KAb 2-4 TaxID=2885158 RepID=UPI001D095931|nr:antibiotic biosynthesis monooxygenase family protein [Acidocella sp. KAb 2-4]MCB5945245.1 antibiotic biosynthesis monooxygenase [Acidocella sp. KAb 2-4]
MVVEFAEIEVKPGMEQEFIAGVEKSKPAFLRSAGCYGLHLVRSVESPSKFVLHVRWESVEHHMVNFRAAPEFQEWRGNVAHCFAAPPHVWHGEVVA